MQQECLATLSSWFCVLQVCRKRELRLIQNQHLLQSPPVKLKAKPLDARLESVRLAQD